MSMPVGRGDIDLRLTKTVRVAASGGPALAPIHYTPAGRVDAASITHDARLSALLATGRRGESMSPPDGVGLLERRFAAALHYIAALEGELAKLRQAAQRDQLTGLLNRPAMEGLIAAAIESPAGCSVAFIDIDRFKAINDTHGHAAGDRALCSFARALEQVFDGHVLARWGGEEFVVLLNGLDAAAAFAAVDAARARMADIQEPLVQGLAPPTFSAGVAASDGRGMETLIHTADERLYRAKDRGRNRVIATELD